jgi:chemotaxis response regulator CheB
LTRIRAAGGIGVVQDPATATRREMPDAAIAAGADHVVELDAIGPLLCRLLEVTAA